VSDFTGSWLAGTYNDQARADPHHPGSSQTFVAGEFDGLDGIPEVERQRELTRRGLDYAADHPGYVAQGPRRQHAAAAHLEEPRWWRRQGWTLSLPRWAAGAAAYAFYALALLALAGRVHARTNRTLRTFTAPGRRSGTVASVTEEQGGSL
jgi:hypothetical protein